MQLEINRRSGNSDNLADFIKTKQDPIETLPFELVVEIFSHLNLTTLGTICCVSKAWKQLANDPISWKKVIYKQIAFGNDKWAQCFGSDVVKEEDSAEEFASLPSDQFIADCKKFKSIFPKRKATDTLMLVRLPKTLNRGLTLKSLGELTKKYFLNNTMGYRFISPETIHVYGDKPLNQSQWVLMTKDVLPESKNKRYVQQQQMVADLAKKNLISYQVPELLEAVTCILSQYFDSRIRLFNDVSWTTTRCKETLWGLESIVGGFTSLGLGVNDFSHSCGTIGIAALRKF